MKKQCNMKAGEHFAGSAVTNWEVWTLFVYNLELINQLINYGMVE